MFHGVLPNAVDTKKIVSIICTPAIYITLNNILCHSVKKKIVRHSMAFLCVFGDGEILINNGRVVKRMVYCDMD